jgi:hypothetical protein
MYSITIQGESLADLAVNAITFGTSLTHGLERPAPATPAAAQEASQEAPQSPPAAEPAKRTRKPKEAAGGAPAAAEASAPEAGAGSSDGATAATPSTSSAPKASASSAPSDLKMEDIQGMARDIASRHPQKIEAIRNVVGLVTGTPASVTTVPPEKWGDLVTRLKALDASIGADV